MFMNDVRGAARVLVVDDDERLRRSLVAMLEADGYAVMQASDGEGAVELAHREPPDLVLLDVTMPGTDAYDLTRQLKGDPSLRAIPVILVTGPGDRKSRQQGLDAGAGEFVTWPVDRTELSVRVRNLLRLQESATLAFDRRFRALVEQSFTGIVIVESGLIVYANPRFLEIFGFRALADIAGRSPLDVVSPSDRARVAERIRHVQSGRWRAEADVFLGQRADGTEIDVGVHAALAVHEGSHAIIAVMQDISERKRAEAEIGRHIARLERALQNTIEVVSAIGELRDPYTHGHERRVGELAAAIAREMGLSAHRVEGVRIAGYVHDVGKIGVPAEILAKPGRLSAMELGLVKLHAQQSFDILKGVDFPWPVAEAARQHHERLDGSGYPRGLKGDEIILEARILAVADTVEAMSSHRPYRPACGVGPALERIEQYADRHYDAQAAKACITLFRERNFQVPV